MDKVQLSGWATAVILAIVLLIVFLVGNRVVNPPQQLGPEAQAMKDAYQRAQSGQR